MATAAAASAGLFAFQATAPDPASVGIESAAAATGGEFNAGNIISDENFYNGQAMSAAEVQQFLSSKNGSSAATALPNYRQATPNMPATAYCAAYPGAGGGESAADIIAKVGQACNFSQKAMLVLLEKEQSLVSMSSPTLGRLAAATGFGCPDTAPCDASFGGFFYQVYNAARQFQYYKANPHSFNHIPFATNNVLYNPNFSCGSSAVTIENYATAGLYNYTPYQPNQAALSNMYGEGDGCSAYGNRNFWRMYTDWFGDTNSAATRPSLIQAQGSSEVFLLSDGVRYFLEPARVETYTAALGAVETIPVQEMNWIKWGPWVGNLITGPDGPVYVSDGKFWNARNADVAASFGYNAENTAKISKEQLAKFDGGWMLESFVQTDNGQLFLIQNQTKREVSNLAALRDFGLFTAVTKLEDSALDFLPAGDPVLNRGGVIEPLDGSTKVVLGDGGKAIAVGEKLTGLSVFKTTAKFGPAFDALSVEGTLNSSLVTDGTGHYLVTDAGLLKVPATTYGAQRFTAVAPDSLVGVPSLGTTGGAHLVKEIGGEKVNLIVGGERVEFANEADAKKEAQRRGSDEVVYLVAAGTLAEISSGNGITNGALIKGEGQDGLFVLDGAHLAPIASAELATAYGFGSTPVTITKTSFEKIPQRTETIDSALYTCNGTTYLAAEGQGHAFVTPKVAADYGTAGEALSAQLCNVIGMSDQAATEFVKTDDGSWYAVFDGAKHAIGWPAIAHEMGINERGSLTVPAGSIDAIPNGSLLTGVPAGWSLDEPQRPEPTPTPTPAPTTEPTPTATPEPTGAPTPTPTESGTPAPTESGTPAPSATPGTSVAPTPTETATPTPTPTEEPAVPLESGDVISDKAGSGTWIVNGEKLLQVGSQQVADQLGLQISDAQVVPAANFAAFETASEPLYSSAVLVGGVPYIGVDGKLVPFASQADADAFGLVFTPLAPEVGISLQVDETAEPIGQVVQALDGSFYRVIDGTLHLIDPSLLTPTATATATESATAEPTETATPTESTTPTPTPSATESATASPTATPTETSTASPTETPVPSETPAPTADSTFVLSAELFSLMGLGEPVAE